MFVACSLSCCSRSSLPVCVLSCADDDDDGCDDDDDGDEGCDDDDDHYLQVFGEVQSVAVTSVTTSSAGERAPTLSIALW